MIVLNIIIYYFYLLLFIKLLNKIMFLIYFYEQKSLGKSTVFKLLQIVTLY